jgi:hypothetical protein
MTKEEVKEYLTINSPSFQKALIDNIPSIEPRVESEWKYLNSEYGKNHRYAEIPIEEVD